MASHLSITQTPHSSPVEEKNGLHTRLRLWALGTKVYRSLPMTRRYHDETATNTAAYEIEMKGTHLQLEFTHTHTLYVQPYIASTSQQASIKQQRTTCKTQTTHCTHVRAMLH